MKKKQAHSCSIYVYAQALTHSHLSQNDHYEFKSLSTAYLF